MPTLAADIKTTLPPGLGDVVHRVLPNFGDYFRLVPTLSVRRSTDFSAPYNLDAGAVPVSLRKEQVMQSEVDVIHPAVPTEAAAAESADALLASGSTRRRR
jgi:hypothetical protein